MSFDLASLRAAIARHGPVARVVVARTEGSAPREVGAAMLVWQDGQSGTIGGGALEYQAARRARARLAGAAIPHLARIPLGPALGQCCGGAVTLLTEVFSEETLQGIEKTGVFARSPGMSAKMPLSVRRLLAEARSHGLPPRPGLYDHWMVEPVAPLPAPLWVYGAGHVGRALVNVITPLPEFVITWVDTSPARFPEIPAGTTMLPAARPQQALAHAPKNAHHVILTYSHALDLELCHAALTHGFASAGLIGSATKWQRFRRRLAALGHAPGQIDRIACPIGDKTLGKHPQAIAIGVARHLLQEIRSPSNREPADDQPSRPDRASHA